MFALRTPDQWLQRRTILITNRVEIEYLSRIDTNSILQAILTRIHQLIGELGQEESIGRKSLMTLEGLGDIIEEYLMILTR